MFVMLMVLMTIIRTTATTQSISIIIEAIINLRLPETEVPFIYQCLILVYTFKKNHIIFIFFFFLLFFFFILFSQRYTYQ